MQHPLLHIKASLLHLDTAVLQSRLLGSLLALELQAPVVTIAILRHVDPNRLLQHVDGVCESMRNARALAT
jgi:hypothetical protein